MRRTLPSWWTGEPPQHWLAGVFEGGGLKGVAYAGALQGVRAESAWFGAVAGASAGAITAALVAAGASPDDIGNLTTELSAVFTHHLRYGDVDPRSPQSTKVDTANAAPSTAALVWHGRSRLRDPVVSALGTGNDLATWLDGQLRRLVSTYWRSEPGLDDPEITFALLHDLTRIELVIVGVDAVSSRHCIFSHSTTPECAVADAAIASSSIPFVLRPRRLEPARGDGKSHRYTYPIVDGGVWTNFPIFVFDDGQFRRYHGLEAQPDLAVVGFLLTETTAGSARAVVTPTAQFVDDSEFDHKQPQRVLPAELLLSWNKAEIDQYFKDGETVTGRVLRPFRRNSLSQVLEAPHTIPGFRVTPRLGDAERVDSTRSSRTTGAQLALQSLEMLGSAFWYTVFAWLGVVGGLLYGIWTLFEHVAAPRTSWREGLIVFALYLLLFLGLTLLVFTIPLLAVNSLGYLAMRKSAAPLASTYVRGAGAPYWLVEPSPFVDGDDAAPPLNVVRLPIRPEISTLRITADDAKAVAAVIDAQTVASRSTTIAALRTLFASRPAARPGVAR